MAHYVEKVDNFDSGLLHLQYVLGPSSFHHLVVLDEVVASPVVERK